MTKINKATTLAVVAAAVLATPALALEPAGYKTAEDLLITPTLKVAERWDDNIRSVELNPEDSLVSTIAPNVNFNKKGKKAEFNLDLGAVQDIFHSSHGDDNLDYYLGSSLALEFDARRRLRLNAGFNHVEETASLVQNLQNDISETTELGLLYGYGAQTARGQLEFGASQRQLRFKNTLVMPSGNLLNADREYDAAVLKGIFYVAVAPKTKGLLEVRRTSFRYTTNTTLDSINLALLAGVKWDATAKTTGSIKVGTETKEFELAGVGERDASKWEASISWSPLSYSTFTLTSNSQLDEGNNGAAVIETQSSSLNWDHQWLKRLSSSANVSVTNQDYLGAVTPSGADRADEITAYGVGVTYAARRWLDVGVGYKFTQNDSNAPTRTYERNLFSVSLTASL